MSAGAGTYMIFQVLGMAGCAIATAQSTPTLEPSPAAQLATSQPVDGAKTDMSPREIKVLGPSGVVVDWDHYIVFEEMPGIDTYTLEVTSPSADSCDLGQNALTIGTPGGKYIKDFSTFLPATNPGVQCAGGYCKIQNAIPVHYLGPADRISDHRCVPVRYTYTWQIRTAQGNYTAVIRFVPTLSDYKVP